MQTQQSVDPSIPKALQRVQFRLSGSQAGESQAAETTQYGQVSQRNHGTQASWLAQVRERQAARMTPEMTAAVAERKRQFRERQMTPKRRQLQKRAERISSCSSMSRAAWVGGMKNMTPERYGLSRSAEVEAMEGMEEEEQHLAQQCQASTDAVTSFHQLQSLMASPATSTAGALSITDEEFEQQQQSVMALGNFRAEDGAVDDSELHELLRELEHEPTCDKECAAKFAIYENYSETVSATRKATLDFWEEASAEFEGSAKASVENSIRQIDNDQNMGFDFESSRKWFVQSMVKQAHANTAIIERLLADMRTKLELLGSQDECPICLEAFAAGEGADANYQLGTTTLACCHKVCKGCWDHWRKANPGNAFCPLCREQDFLVQIMPADGAAAGVAGAAGTAGAAGAGAMTGDADAAGAAWNGAAPGGVSFFASLFQR
jgi:hypothetical protein